MTEPALRWIDCRAGDAALHPRAIADLFARRLDGLTIAGVFTPAELERAVPRLSVEPSSRTPAMFGTMLGMSLAEVAGSARPHDRRPYLDSVQRCREHYADAFSFDPHARVASVVGPLAGGLAVRPPCEGGRHYSPGNIRWFEPGTGGLPAHAGNEFQMHEDPSAVHLRTTTVTQDHLSWFVVLQAPEAGGELTVYDRVIETYRPSDDSWSEAGRQDGDFEALPAKHIDPEPGTMVVFGGGWRWHRVEPVLGSRARITYGGFGGPSVDGLAVHLWF